MNVVNIVDSLEQVNYGIWNSAVSTACHLHNEYGVVSYLVYPATENCNKIESITQIPIDRKSISVDELVEKYNFTINDTIVVSHGCWQYPTRLASQFTKKGFHWIYVPHGMLEPSSLKQKYIFKKLYFELFEKPMVRNNASSVRAVSLPELKNLNKYFNQVVHIPNGIDDSKISTNLLKKKSTQFLFMARIHKQKSALELVKAWQKSKLSSTEGYELIIAGPDDGQLSDLLNLIKNIPSVKYVGAKYGKEKEELLLASQFYLLPSKAEGFPTSVVEAMAYGAIPIISEFCNFPEIYNNGMAIPAEPKVDSICNALNMTVNICNNELESKSKLVSRFIEDNYTLNKIATQQFDLYSSLLNR